MSQEIKNLPASIIRRLLNESKRRGISNSEVLQHFGMERFLYRLSKTEFCDCLILKGGLIFHGWELPMRRPTRDIDFLGVLENKKEVIDKVLRTVMSVPAPEDGIYYDPGTISIVDTHVDADRNGMQAKFQGFLGRALISMKIDFGFSDELASSPIAINFPTILKDLPQPRLMAYPMEAVVAEKFHAMVRFASIPSRWKDYYDLWLLSGRFEFSAGSLQAAISLTFNTRSTAIPTARPDSLSVEFASKYEKAWKVFLQKEQLENEEIKDLSAAVERIWTFLERPLTRLQTIGNRRKNERWDPIRRKWK